MQGYFGNEKVLAELISLATKRNYAHGYIFIGVGNIGKTTAALEFARTILCEEGGKADCSCTNCKLARNLSHPDLHVLDGDTGVEDIRELIAKLELTPYQAKEKVAVITHIDQVSISAMNSFLKTLEEPPESTVIILTTEHLESVPATVVSRLRQVGFSSGTDKGIANYLNQELGIKRGEANDISLVAAGRIGYALSLSQTPGEAAKRALDAKEFLRVYKSNSIADKIALAMSLASDKNVVSERLSDTLSFTRKLMVSAEARKNRAELVSAAEDIAKALELISKNINLKLVTEALLLGSINK